MDATPSVNRAGLAGAALIDVALDERRDGLLDETIEIRAAARALELLVS